MRFSVSGVPAFVNALNRYERKSGANFKRSLQVVSKLLVATARPNAPIDTGALRASGVWWTEGTGWSSEAIVGFGGPVEGFYDDWGREKVPREYAVYQHDDPGGHLFLEYAVDDKYWEISHIIQTEVAKA